MASNDKISARVGWEWVKQGFALFRKQPMEMATLFFSYTFILLALSLIPVVGQLLPVILTPVFSMAFMEACVKIERGERVFPSTLLTGFRSPAFRSLLLLGLLYLPAALLAFGASALVDGGTFWEIFSGQAKLDPATLRASNVGMAVLVAAGVYTLAAMAFWYAAPLIMWNGMGVGKAMFYSFFAVRKAFRAFLVYGLAWLNIGILLPAFASSLLAILLGKTTVASIILMPALLMMTVIAYCSFYPTYATIFGKREPEASAPEKVDLQK